MNTVLLLLTLLFVKHFIVDFPLQKPYHYLNKGIYRHPGGIQHSALHGAATALCFLIISPGAAIVAGFTDFAVHYHVDWTKVKLNTHYGLKPDNSEYYWWLLGADQLAHALTYLGLAYYLLG